SASDCEEWGSTVVSTHERYPTTAPRGNFCLLRFRPGPVRPSLDHLVRQGSPNLTIWTRCLARTLDQHRRTEDRTPKLTPSNSLDLQCSWITRPRHRSRSISLTLFSYLILLTKRVSSVQ
ncbi:uncharacterized protein NPIL_661081, partial [Nephila pilipes]